MPPTNRHLQLMVLLLATVTTMTLADNQFYQGPDVTCADILHARGYEAKEFFIITSAGYVLRITRGRNPLIAGGHLDARDPVLFLHGTLGHGSDFLLNSFGAAPKDFTGMNISSMSLDELQERLRDEPSARVLPLLALNFGHEVWILDRRGTSGSQQLLGDPLSIKATPSRQRNSSLATQLAELVVPPVSYARQVAFTADAKFWSFSLDEQAEVDFPDTLDFVLGHSPYASRVSIVGHSAGAAITLMGLSMRPELGRKISSCIFWSPAYATSNENPRFVVEFSPLVALIESMPGPSIPPFIMAPLQAALIGLCTSTSMLPFDLCEIIVDHVFGDSGQQQPVNPQFIGGFLHSVSRYELSQMGQTIRYLPNSTLHKFDYGLRNMQVYGQPTPPAYDLSTVRNYSSFSFYGGVNDFLVGPADIDVTRRQLKVPSQYHLIGHSFNHIGYFTHKQVAELAVIPSMREIQTLA